MINKILPTILLASSLSASNELITKIQQLQTQIQELKKQSDENKQDLDEYIPIIEASETQSLMDKVDFLPELEVRVDKMNYDLGEIQGENTEAIYPDSPLPQQRRDEFSKDFDPAVAVKFRLNVIGNIDKYTKFNGRFIFTNSSQSNQRLCILSRDIKSVSASSAFDVDRAYVDYTPNVDSDYAFTFSFGVLPTTGGTPMNFALNAERKSMFPALVFDMNTYGFIATQKFGDGNFARFIAAKAYTLQAEFYPYQCNRENIDNANIYGLFIDTEFDVLDGKGLLSFGLNHLGDFKAHPYLGPDVNSDDASILGSIGTFGVGIDVRELYSDKLTFFVHTAMSHTHPNDSVDDYQLVDNDNDGDPDTGLTSSGIVGFSTADYAQGGMIDNEGYSVYLGMKYDINEKIDLGLEYNKGTKYWFSATQGAEDMYNKLATRGSVIETYAIYNFHKYIYAKLGYMYTKEEFTGSGWHFGDPVKKDGEQQISYLSIKAEF